MLLTLKNTENNKQEIEIKIIETIAKKAAEKTKVPDEEDKIKSALDSFLMLPNPFVNFNGETTAIKMTKYTFNSTEFAKGAENQNFAEIRLPRILVITFSGAGSQNRTAHARIFSPSL